MKEYIMSMDQGTTSCRCILYSRQGEAVSNAQKEFTQHYPVPGWVEHDPMEIWETQLFVAKDAMHKIGATFENIHAIGITNQRETTVVWDRMTGKPLCNAIVWQCRRTAVLCEELKTAGHAERIKEKTGLPVDAYFSGTKLKWILDNHPGAREKAAKGDLLFGTVETWLIWKLTGGAVHATDFSNASRTMLFHIEALDWDDELLSLLDIPRAMLPKPMPSSCLYGETAPEIFGGRIAIAGAAGDQQAALFGQTCFAKGEAKNTYGTGCFLLMNTGNQRVRSENGLLTTVAWGALGKVDYALEGSVFVAGAAIQWLRDEMKLIEKASDTETLAREVEDSAGVYVVPAFVGFGAPYWDSHARGAVFGLTRGAGRNHFVRAALESIAYQTHDLIRAMERDAEFAIPSLKVDGGACANGFLMQFQADILGADVIRPSNIETTSLGAAYLAGLASGFWDNLEDLQANAGRQIVFSPDMEADKRETLLAGWAEAVRKCRL